MAKKALSKPANYAELFAATPRGKAILDIIRVATDTWIRVDPKKAGAVLESAIIALLDAGLVESRIVVISEMAGENKIKTRYICGGDYYELLKAEMDRIVPSRWYGSDGKPKHDLNQAGAIVALRLTNSGLICKNALSDGQYTLSEIFEYIHDNEIEPYIRLDGVVLPDSDTGLLISGKLSPRDLAKKYNVGQGALQKRLDRWRYEHDAGYSEVSNAARNEPKYLYDEIAVMPVINSLKSRQGKRATNVQQKNI